MVAATEKKKRGRPRKYTQYEESCMSSYSLIFNVRDNRRNLQNYCYAMDALNTMYGFEVEEMDEEIASRNEKIAEQFIYRADNEDEYNHLRYQGVLEQIGRMYNAELINDDEVVEWAIWALNRIKVDGHTSREVEKELRQYRLSVAATKKQEG